MRFDSRQPGLQATTSSRYTGMGYRLFAAYASPPWSAVLLQPFQLHLQLIGKAGARENHSRPIESGVCKGARALMRWKGQVHPDGDDQDHKIMFLEWSGKETGGGSVRGSGQKLQPAIHAIHQP